MNDDLNQIHHGLGDNIGRDKIIVKLNSISKETNQLVSILEFRAIEINKNLSSFYEYVEIEDYLDEFNRLHALHVSAIRRNDLILAHEILRKIYNLSSEIENSEFWEDHRINRPGTFYQLLSDAFSRGELICGYIVGELENRSMKYPSYYSEFEKGHFQFSSKTISEKSYLVESDIVLIYELILKSD